MKIGKLGIVCILFLMICNSVGAVWIHPDVDILVENFTLNTITSQNFTYVEIGDTYTNLSWGGSTYHNITYVSNVCSSESVIHKSPGFSLNQSTNISFNLYAPSNYSVSITLKVLTAASVEDASVTPTLHHSNTTHRFYYYHYNPSNTIPDTGLGYFDVNISATVTNTTLTYTGYNLTEDLFYVFLVEPPYNGTGVYNTTLNAVNLTWQNGNNSEYTVVVQNNNSYPTSPSDGWVRSNSTSFTTFNDSSVYSTRYYTIFNYNTTYNMYSSGLNIPWGALGLSCYNESNPSQAIGFDIEITNSDASITYTASDLTNTQYIDLNDIPYGDNTVIIITNSSYKLRTYYKDLTVNQFYNFSFYLPPLETESDDGTEDGTLRTYTNVAEVTNSSVNVTINLTHTLESTIGVYRYDNIPVYSSYTDSITVTDSSLDATINFTHTPDSITAVYIYNDTTYGGWILVPQDKYTYNTTELVVNNSWMDANTTTARVDYFYISGYSGSWIMIPDNMYTATSSQVEIDNATLNSNTTMVKVEYWYMDYDTTVDTQLYFVRVVDGTSNSVADAKVIIKRYINTTAGYAEIGSMKTDGYGYASIYLVPNTLYKVFVSKTGFESRVDDWITDPVYYGLSYPKTIQMSLTESVYTNETTFNEAVTLAASMSDTGVITVSYSDTLEETISTCITIYYSDNLTAFHYDNRTGEDSFSFDVYDANTSLTYQVVFVIHHTTFGEQSIVLYIIGGDSPYSSLTNTTWFDNLFTANYGTSPGGFGWSNILGFFVMVAGLFGFGQRNTGVAMLVTGGILLFINFIIGLNVIGATIPILFIVLGILVQWRNHRKEAVG